MHWEELNFFQKDITSDFLKHAATEEVYKLYQQHPFTCTVQKGIR
jgi:hypothetical protein